MSTLSCKVVRFDLEKHSNADSLSLVYPKGTGWCCVVRSADLAGLDKAIYIPLDAVVPADDPRWAFMEPKKYRVKTIKLRGVISQGLMVPLFCTCSDLPAIQAQVNPRSLWVHFPDCVLNAEVGDDVTERIRVKKWEPPPLPPWMTGKCEPDDPNFSKFTDVEHFRKFTAAIPTGEQCAVTCKIHGSNGRWGLVRQPDGSLVYKVGSHNKVKAQDDNNIWAVISQKYGLKEALRQAQQIDNIPHLKDAGLGPDCEIVLFGEVFGYRVQDLTYGLQDIDVAFFDVMIEGRYLDYPAFNLLCTALNLPMVPLLYEGQFTSTILDYANGMNIAGVPGSHIREGCVIRPMKERWDQEVGRVILKVLSPSFLMRGGEQTEFH